MVKAIWVVVVGSMRETAAHLCLRAPQMTRT